MCNILTNFNNGIDFAEICPGTHSVFKNPVIKARIAIL